LLKHVVLKLHGDRDFIVMFLNSKQDEHDKRRWKSDEMLETLECAASGGSSPMPKTSRPLKAAQA
jgi:hypothetical protein